MVLAAVVVASSVRAGGSAGNQGAMEPNPPRDIEIENVTSTTVEIDWRRPSRGGEDGYIV